MRSRKRPPTFRLAPKTTNRCPMSDARRAPWRCAGSPREPGGSIPNDPAQPGEPLSERKVVHTHGGAGREYELSPAVDQARCVQTCDCIDSPEMLAALAFELSNRPRPLRIGSQQQTEDPFSARSSSSAGIRLISSCMGRSFLSLPRPGQFELRRGTFRLGFRQAERQDAISTTTCLSAYTKRML